MFSPESLTRARPPHAMVVLRIAVERKGIIGFIEAPATTSLVDARALIAASVDDAPAAFQFVLDDGTPVSVRQEPTQSIATFFPCMTLRPAKRPDPDPARDDGALAECTSPTIMERANRDPDRDRERISVWTRAGDECLMWISREYTFQQLRCDAARYWGVPPRRTTLVDADGCLWPEQARILALMTIDELQQHRIVLTCDHDNNKTSSQQQRLGGRSMVMRPSTSGMLTSASTSVSGNDCSKSSSWSSRRARREYPQPLDELWLIFTFYCVSGDSLELESLKAHQFVKLLRDCHVLGSAGLTPAVAHIIYTSETKGKAQASGRMNFDEFLNALAQIATMHFGSSHAVRRPLQDAKALDAKTQDALVLRLVTERILPSAARWPSLLWHRQTELLRSADIVSFVAKFVDALLAIFMFYAKSHVLHRDRERDALGAKEFFMAYSDYQRVVNDFALASLQVSSVEAAQVFLAACLSAPLHETFLSARAELRVGSASSTDTLLDEREISVAEAGTEAAAQPRQSETASSLAEGSFAATLQRVLSDADGIALFLPAQAQIGRLCMSLSAFIDALCRLGLVAFSKHNANIPPLAAIKGVFHHLARNLTRARVHSILRNHGTASIHANKFYSGAVAFSARFLEVWRSDGSPDYLAASRRSARSGEMTLSSSLADEEGSAKTLVPMPVSPSRRLVASSAVLFDARVVVNGTGKGRAALSRLTRDAFVRNASSSVSSSNPTNASRLDRTGTTPSTAAAAKTIAVVADRGHPTEAIDQHRKQSPPQQDPTKVRTGSDPQLDASSSPTDADASSHREQSVSASSAVEAETELGISFDVDSFLTDGDPAPPTAKVAQDDAPPLSPCSAAQLSAVVAPHSLSPPMPPPPATYDEMALFASVLVQGSVFKHHGHWGAPQKRFVWCSPELDALFLRSIASPTNAQERVVTTAMLEIVPGDAPRTRYAFLQHVADEQALVRCFSIVMADRRIDLEADSQAIQELWIQALGFLLVQQQKRRLGATSISAGIATSTGY